MSSVPPPQRDQTALKVSAIIVGIAAAVVWAITVLFAVSFEKALAMVILGTVGVVILLLVTGLSPF